MEVGGVYDDSHVANVFSKNEILDSLTWVPNSSPSFHGSAATMVNFEDGNNSERQFLKTYIDSTKSEKFDDDDEYDECFHHKPAGKKRRLMPEQVQYLEKSFDVENKLEPERKSQLAKQLGLQPRQVAIWFQNRRARSKTKVLEKEYVSLKASYDKLKADYDTLFEENDKMKNEVHLLTEKLLTREKLSDPINIPLDLLPKKQELASNVDASSSAKSDVFDSESPHYALEGATDYSSHVFEFEASDFSQDEDDDVIRRGLVPKIEAEEDDLQPNSGNLGFPVQHQGTWLWQY